MSKIILILKKSLSFALDSFNFKKNSEVSNDSKINSFNKDELVKTKLTILSIL